jgi:hypothetical protein
MSNQIEKKEQLITPVVEELEEIEEFELTEFELEIENLECDWILENAS